MMQKTNRLIIFVTLFSMPFLFAFVNMATLKTAYRISEASRLYLEGSSNVNQFTCNCKEQFGNRNFELAVTSNGQVARFSQTALRVPVRKLDCGHKGINKDLFQTLKGDEHPYIKIELKKIEQRPGSSLDNAEEWAVIQAQTAITIAGVTRLVNLSVRGQKQDHQQYRFVSAKTLKMSSFGLEPPRALLGLIKVDDAITIHFDLVITILEDSITRS